LAGAPDSEPYDVLVGVVVGAHGVRGELRVAPETDFPERFARLEVVSVAEKGRPPQLMKLAGARQHPAKGLVLLRLEGVDDRDAADALRGAQLRIRESDLVPLPPGQYYEFQILGLQVVTEEGRDLGKIIDIIHTGANDVYETPMALIPAIEQVMREVDLARGRVVVHWVEGMEKGK
jgi:16S rRNA processing protein RimM